MLTQEDTHILQATNAQQILACYPIMRQLRPHLTDDNSFVKQVQRQMKDGYQLIYLQQEQEIKAVAGFRFLEFLAWGKVLYIDDLITDSATRKNGYGGKLLRWIMDLSRAKGCDQVHLDSGPQRHDAHKLYLKQGFKIIGYHFAKE